MSVEELIRQSYEDTAAAVLAVQDLVTGPQGAGMSGAVVQALADTASVAARAHETAERAAQELEREKIRANAELDMLKRAMHNERLDILANTTRVYLRLRANGCDKLEKRLDDAVLSSNRTAAFMNALVEMPVGPGAREVLAGVAERQRLDQEQLGAPPDSEPCA
jgi:hypothetical protein